MSARKHLQTVPLPLIIYLCVRIPLLLALSFEGLRGYGDLAHFYNLAEIPGLPYINYWIEFPPAFAFLNKGLFAIAGGVEHTFTYLFVLVLLVADFANVFLFLKLETLVEPGRDQPSWRSLVYAAILAGLPYSWWYFDTLAVFFMLLALYLAVSRRNLLWTGLAIGGGFLVKVFPVLILPGLFKISGLRKSVLLALVAGISIVLPFFALYQVSPVYTAASLASRSIRASFETVWALINNDRGTGDLGPLVQRLDPGQAYHPIGNPDMIQPLGVLVVFFIIGIYFWLRAHLDNPLKLISFVGLTMVIFFVWSPTWSPQWILHMIPISLLVLPFSPGILLVAALILDNLLEWPLLLSRGLFYTLPFTIFLRLALMALLGVLFYQSTQSRPVKTEPVPQTGQH
jgi:hypothetical protein